MPKCNCYWLNTKCNNYVKSKIKLNPIILFSIHKKFPNEIIKNIYNWIRIDYVCETCKFRKINQKKALDIYNYRKTPNITMLSNYYNNNLSNRTLNNYIIWGLPNNPKY